MLNTYKDPSTGAPSFWNEPLDDLTCYAYTKGVTLKEFDTWASLIRSSGQAFGPTNKHGRLLYTAREAYGLSLLADASKAGARIDRDVAVSAFEFAINFPTPSFGSRWWPDLRGSWFEPPQGVVGIPWAKMTYPWTIATFLWAEGEDPRRLLGIGGGGVSVDAWRNAYAAREWMSKFVTRRFAREEPETVGPV